MRPLPATIPGKVVLGPDAVIAHIAERQHSVFSGDQARRAGLSQSATERRVRAGLWDREYRRVFRIRGSPRTFQSQALAAVLAGGAGALAAATTAARLHGLDDMTDGRRHITVPGRRCVTVPGVVVHRPQELARRDRTRVGVIPATSPALTLIDLASTLEHNALEETIDDAIRKGLVNAHRLARRVDALCPNGRRGVLVLRRLLHDRVDEPVPGSKWETRLRRLLIANGLPLPSGQLEIFAPDGRFIGRPDLVYPGARLFIEFDGYAFHSSRIAWEDGISRQNELVALGYRPLRVTKRQVENAPSRVVELVSAALAAPIAANAAEMPNGRVRL